MKVIVKRYFIILFMSCLSSVPEAQEIKVYGTLQDSETLAGISYANISFPGSKTGDNKHLFKQNLY